MDLFDLSGKVAFVAGGYGGIGAAVASIRRATDALASELGRLDILANCTRWQAGAAASRCTCCRYARCWACAATATPRIAPPRARW